MEDIPTFTMEIDNSFAQLKEKLAEQIFTNSENITLEQRQLYAKEQIRLIAEISKINNDNA